MWLRLIHVFLFTSPISRFHARPVIPRNCVYLPTQHNKVPILAYRSPLSDLRTKSTYSVSPIPPKLKNFGGTSSIKSSKNKFIYTHLVRINNEPIKLKSINPFLLIPQEPTHTTRYPKTRIENWKIEREKEIIKFARRKREREMLACERPHCPVVARSFVRKERDYMSR